MESEGSFFRSRLVPSFSDTNDGELKGYSSICNAGDHFIRKCSICGQDFYGLESNYDYEDLKTLCTLFINSDSGSKSGYNLCNNCGTLLNNLVRARDVFLQCFNDLITTAGRWLPEGEKSEIVVRLLNYSCGKSRSQLHDVNYGRGGVELLTCGENHPESEDPQEQINMPEIIPSIELSNECSVEHELSRDSLEIDPAVEKAITHGKNSIKSSKTYAVCLGPCVETSSRILAVQERDEDVLENVLPSEDEDKQAYVLPSEDEDKQAYLPSICEQEEKQSSFDVLDPGGTCDEKEVSKKKKIRKLHNCSICSRCCKTARELDLHMGVHLQERKFICEVCGLAYRHKKALEVHVGLHRGEAKFECEHCHKVFTQKSGLQRHLPIHTGEMAYQCDICGKRFLYNTSFNVHKFTHTKHKEFQCFECGLSFFSKSHLKRHMKTHTGVKPHVCENCGKRFSERYNLDAHMRIHTGQKSHKCPHCELGFNRKGKLEAHLLQKHS